MKMYYFNPNNFSEEYFVMAENEIKAHEYLLNFLENEKINKSYASKIYQEHIDMWKKVNPLDITTLPDKYTLEEHEVGSVVQTEIS